MNEQPFPKFREVRSLHIAIALSTLALIALIAAFNVEIEMKQDVPCEIVADGELRVDGVTGTVTAVYGKAGDRVRAGARLFDVSRDFSLSADGAQRQAFDQRARMEQLSATQAAYEARGRSQDAQRAAQEADIRSRRDELGLLSGELSANRELIAQSRESLARMERYREYVPLDRLEQARADVQVRRIALQQGLARQRQLQSDIARMEAETATMRAQRDASDAERRRDLGNVANTYELRRSDSTVAAPIDGTVQFSAIYVGTNLQATDVAMIVAGKTSRLRAQLRIPSRRRGFVRAGQRVRLKFDAFPYARFGSYPVTIASVSDNAIPIETPDAMPAATPAAKDEGDQYVAWADLPSRVFVANGKSHAILPGMRATASVVIERRTIAQWVLAPLFEAVRG